MKAQPVLCVHIGKQLGQVEAGDTARQNADVPRCMAEGGGFVHVGQLHPNDRADPMALCILHGHGEAVVLRVGFEVLRLAEAQLAVFAEGECVAARAGFEPPDQAADAQGRKPNGCGAVFGQCKGISQLVLHLVELVECGFLGRLLQQIFLGVGRLLQHPERCGLVFGRGVRAVQNTLRLSLQRLLLRYQVGLRLFVLCLFQLGLNGLLALAARQVNGGFERIDLRLRGLSGVQQGLLQQILSRRNVFTQGRTFVCGKLVSGHPVCQRLLKARLLRLGCLLGLVGLLRQGVGAGQVLLGLCELLLCLGLCGLLKRELGFGLGQALLGAVGGALCLRQGLLDTFELCECQSHFVSIAGLLRLRHV